MRVIPDESRRHVGNPAPRAVPLKTRREITPPALALRCCVDAASGASGDALKDDQMVSPTSRSSVMSSYRGISSGDKQKVISALKARGAGSCPRCDDSQWTVSEYSRIEVQDTSARDGAHGV